MGFITGFVKTVALTSAIIVTLASLAVLSVVPVMILRFWLLPEYLLTVPVDFVAKNIRGHSTGLSHRYLVASINIGEIPDFSKHDYSFELQLKLPRNDQNLDLGNFAIRGALGSQNWLKSSELDLSKVDVVERMGIIPFKSSFVERATRYLFSPFYIMEWWGEESLLTIPMWHTAIKPKRKTPYLLLTLPAKLTVSEAHLVFEVQLHGIRWLLKQYPIFTTLVGSAMTFMGSCTSVATFVVIVYQKYLHVNSPPRLHINSRSNYLNRPSHFQNHIEHHVPKHSQSTQSLQRRESTIKLQETSVSPSLPVNLSPFNKVEVARLPLANSQSRASSIRQRKQGQKNDPSSKKRVRSKNVTSLLELEPGFSLADTFLMSA